MVDLTYLVGLLTFVWSVNYIYQSWFNRKVEERLDALERGEFNDVQGGKDEFGE